jgi:hypothetical protein
MTDYIHLAVGNEMSGKMNLSYPLHPMLARAYKYLYPKFENIIIINQDLLSSEVHQKRFLSLLPQDLA